MRRRTKRGLAARQMDAISRAMRRDRGLPLPRTWVSKGHGITLTVTLGEKDDTSLMDELWDDEPEFDGEYDPALSVDQARWRPPPTKSVTELLFDHATRR